MDDIQLNITLGIIVLTGLISYKGFSDRSFFEKFKHSPYSEDKNKDYIRFLSSGFLHGGGAHLFFNMIVLLSFGNNVESFFVKEFGILPGRLLYILMYLTCIVAANIPSFLKHKNNPGYGAIGASGAVSGVLFISILKSPLSEIGFLFIPVGIPGYVFGILYLVYSSWAAKKQDTRIGHDAHFYGALYGMAFITLFNYEIVPSFIREIANAF